MSPCGYDSVIFQQYIKTLLLFYGRPLAIDAFIENSWHLFQMQSENDEMEIIGSDQSGR